MTFDVPNFVRIEFWSSVEREWRTSHAGLNLMNPEKYVTGVTKRGQIIARAVIIDTGEIIYPTGYGADLL